MAGASVAAASSPDKPAGHAVDRPCKRRDVLVVKNIRPPGMLAVSNRSRGGSVYQKHPSAKPVPVAFDC